jgi:hypothetical protein
MLDQKKIIITQSNYIPWKGYFDSIAGTNVFVVYDDMQYTKRDWRNRNLVKTPMGLKWLTVPVEVSGKYFQKIKDTKIADKSWPKTHWAFLKQNYKTASAYKEVSDWIENLYLNCNFEYLTDVNMHFISEINTFLDISTEIRHSSEFDLADEKTERLVKICKVLNATDYFSGPAAKAYMDESSFYKEGVNIHYWDYSNYPEYRQLYPPFEHGVSILDLIFSEGHNAKKFLKCNQ